MLKYLKGFPIFISVDKEALVVATVKRNGNHSYLQQEDY